MTKLDNLPIEIIDLILNMCNYDHPSGTFIKFEYIIQSSIRRIYHEYTGSMQNSQPHGTGTMFSGSRYTDQSGNTLPLNTIMQENREQPLQHFVTSWLYLPFLYMIPNLSKDYRLRYVSIE